MAEIHRQVFESTVRNVLADFAEHGGAMKSVALLFLKEPEQGFPTLMIDDPPPEPEDRDRHIKKMCERYKPEALIVYYAKDDFLRFVYEDLEGVKHYRTAINRVLARPYLGPLVQEGGQPFYLRVNPAWTR